MGSSLLRGGGVAYCAMDDPQAEARQVTQKRWVRFEGNQFRIGKALQVGQSGLTPVRSNIEDHGWALCPHRIP